MSGDHESVEDIERHNVNIARRILEYWQRQGIKIELSGDRTALDPRSGRIAARLPG